MITSNGAKIVTSSGGSGTVKQGGTCAGAGSSPKIPVVMATANNTGGNNGSKSTPSANISNDIYNTLLQLEKVYNFLLLFYLSLSLSLSFSLVPLPTPLCSRTCWFKRRTEIAIFCQKLALITCINLKRQYIAIVK